MSRPDPATPDTGELRLGDVLAAGRRHRLLLVVGVALGVLAGLVSTLFARPAYEAEAKVLIEEEDDLPSSLAGLAGMPGISALTGGGSAVAAEIERILSRRLLRQVLLPGADAGDDDVLVPLVVDRQVASVLASLRVKLGLDPRPPEEEAGLEVEFTRWAYAPEESPLLRVTFRADGRVAVARGTLFGAAEQLYDWSPGAPIEYDRATFTLAPEADLTGRSFVVGARTLRQAVDDLLDTLVVEERGRGSNVLGVTWYGPAPDQAAELVNQLVETFRAQRMDLSQTDTGRTIQALEGEIARIDRQLVLAEDAAADWALEAGPSALPEQAQALVEGRSEAYVEQVRADYTAESLERLLEPIRAGEVGEEELVALEQTELLEAGMIEPLFALVAEREGLRVTYEDPYPELSQMIARIDSRLVGVALVLEGQVEEQRRLSGEAARVVADFDQQLAELPEAQVEYARHEREIQTLSELGLFYRAQLEDAKLRRAATTPNAEVLDWAVEPLYRDRPSVKLNAAVGGVVGLALAVALGFLLELRRPVVDAGRLGEVAGAPVLGTLHGRPLSRWLSARDAPRGRHADDVRVLRQAVLQRAAALGGCRSLAVTSTRRGEGRTRTAANLAFALTHSGERVLLVDADVRRRELSRRLGGSGAPAPAAFDVADPGAAARSAGLDELDLLVLGGERSLADQVDAGLAPAFFEAAGARWQRLLFDVPEVGTSADALAVCRVVDAVVLVARAGRVGEADVSEAAARLRRVGAQVIGVVLNRA